MTKTEDTAPWNPKNEHHAFLMAHNRIYDMANDYFTEIEKPIVRIKGKYRDATVAEKQEASGRSPWLDRPEYYFPVFSSRGEIDALHHMCESWFFRNCDKMIEGMFHSHGWRNIEDAIKSTRNYKELYSDWDIWFLKRRETFMAKQNSQVTKAKGVPAKTPASHGGVANLLKTLTKTMIQQGASIQSIAKVQYAVCTQAGIYIPDEFLTDVSVAIDYNEEIKQYEVTE